MLDYVIARTSGQTYDDFMRQEVFVKLGLTHTSVGIGPGLEPYEAIRYDDDTGAPIPPYDFDHPGASAVYSSAHDLVRFGMFHLKDHLADQRAILTDASIDEMHRATVAAEGDLAGSGYGVGWFSRDRADGYRVVSHSGGMPGVATILDLVPAEDIAVVVLSNGGGRVPGAVRDAIMKKLLPRWQIQPNQHGNRFRTSTHRSRFSVYGTACCTRTAPIFRWYWSFCLAATCTFEWASSWPYC